MRKQKVKIGYEMHTGEKIEIPLAHTVITGLTQEAGKTTCIMGLVKRSGLKALIIKTKIGEKAVTEGTIVPPFYKADFDWEYASELLEASRKEKMRFERSWIIKYSKGATSLLEFKKNIDNALAGEKLRELDKSVLISLQAYLDKILPELTYAPLSKVMNLSDGINIMDLERFKAETQMLIIRSVLNEVLNKDKGVIVVIPEAWRIIPEDLATPVKRPAEEFIRQGATNQNYLWIDSQDITGTSKVILKQVSNWILGYQRELNEIKRTLDQIPVPKSQKPKPEDVATLGLGEFFVATSEFTKNVYAQPVWVSDEDAKSIALGKMSAKDLEQPTMIASFARLPTKDNEEPASGALTTLSDTAFLPINKKINELRDDFLQNRNDFFNKFQQINESFSGIYKEFYELKNKPAIDEDEVVRRILQKVPMPLTSGTENKNYTGFSGTELDSKIEAIVAKLLSKMPQSQTATYTVSPLEKIKKDFLEEAKNKILGIIEKLDDEQKKIIKFIEAQQKGCTLTNIIDKGLFLSATSGGNRDKISKKTIEMNTLGVIRRDKNASCYANLKNLINIYLGEHGATEQEIEQVYNYILVEMIK